MKEFIIENDGLNKLSEWLRTSFIDDYGQIYLPVAAFADEQLAFMCLAFDGNITTVSHEGHYYAPTWWLINEYPKHKKAIEIMRDRVQQEAIQQAS